MSRERTSGVVDPELRLFKRHIITTSERVKYDEGSATVYHSKPPDHLTRDTVPVLLLQGFAVNDPKIRRMYAVIYEGGRELIAPQKIDISQIPGRVHEGRGYGLEDFKKALFLIKMLKERNLKEENPGPVDVLSISGGSPIVLLASIMEPSLFRYVGLITPAAMNGETRVSKITFRYAMRKKARIDPRLCDPKVDPSPWQVGREFGRHVFGNPKNAFSEIRGIAKTDSYKLAQWAARKGVRIFVMCAKNDNIFPTAEIHKRREQAGHTLENAPFEEYHEVDGDHDENSQLEQARPRAMLRVFERVKLADKQKGILV